MGSQWPLKSILMWPVKSETCIVVSWHCAYESSIWMPWEWEQTNSVSIGCYTDANIHEHLFRWSISLHCKATPPTMYSPASEGNNEARTESDGTTKWAVLLVAFYSSLCCVYIWSACIWLWLPGLRGLRLDGGGHFFVALSRLFTSAALISPTNQNYDHNFTKKSIKSFLICFTRLHCKVTSQWYADFHHMSKISCLCTQQGVTSTIPESRW